MTEKRCGTCYHFSESICMWLTDNDRNATPSPFWFTGNEPVHAQPNVSSDQGTECAAWKDKIAVREAHRLASSFLPGDKIVLVKVILPRLRSDEFGLGTVRTVAHTDLDGDAYTVEDDRLCFNDEWALLDGRCYSNPDYLKRDPLLRHRPGAWRLRLLRATGRLRFPASPQDKGQTE